MSDHPKEAHRNLKRIYICNDNCLDLFHLLAPKKLGLEVALLSRKFDALVDTHFRTRKWALGKLRIMRCKDTIKIAKVNPNGTVKFLPFPQMPLPNSIVGFARIDICLTNSDVTAFLQRIGRLLESDVCLEYIYFLNWHSFGTPVWPLPSLSAVSKLHFQSPSAFRHFFWNTSRSILHDCSNLRLITFSASHPNESVQFPIDDSAGDFDQLALCNWLHTPRADGRPKVLKCARGNDQQMETLKTRLLNSSTAVNFLIRFSAASFAPFEVVNAMTRERLSGRTSGHSDDDGDGDGGDDGKVCLVERGPIDKKPLKWDEWKREALAEGGTNDWKVIGIHFL